MKKMAFITGKQFNENYNDIVGINKIDELDIVVLTYDVTEPISTFSHKGSCIVRPSVVKGLVAASLTKQFGINADSVEVDSSNNEALEGVLKELRTVAIRHLNNRKDELRV